MSQETLLLTDSRFLRCCPLFARHGISPLAAWSSIIFWSTVCHLSQGMSLTNHKISSPILVTCVSVPCCLDGLQSSRLLAVVASSSTFAPKVSRRARPISKSVCFCLHSDALLYSQMLASGRTMNVTSMVRGSASGAQNSTDMILSTED
ncbi:hypothetical protein NEOLEDRAFT_618488 [Neolentinus lepideus HHB14362 ss-1]|uniref:Uncharacterized protein n=1 Tax=Neolentinus lepideus HHB14362 ss-1 TaxID=1314782 RepID=A0A165QW62_9AGAM|nr:hypothetical protein NEOLEDRAFT_618488 [Neolentinus lepideus HHB14362 ss-1]